MSSVREKMAKRIFIAGLIAENTDEDIVITDKDWDEFVLHHGDVGFWLNQADQLLSLKHPNGEPMLYVGAEDQSLPENPYELGVFEPDIKQCAIRQAAYNNAQIDMADFKRIEVEE